MKVQQNESPFSGVSCTTLDLTFQMSGFSQVTTHVAITENAAKKVAPQLQLAATRWALVSTFQYPIICYPETNLEVIRTRKCLES